jgi:ribosomal protein S18 acetylase RimI-like enzyme
MARLEIVDVTDEARFELIPPCADPSFDHRTCDYWEDPERGSRASRPSWLPAGWTASAAGSGPGSSERSAAGSSTNPFAPPPRSESNPFLPAPKAASNPFAPAFTPPTRNPFLDDLTGSSGANPFAPQRPGRPTVAADAPRKLQLLGRGLGVFGTYAKLLLVDGEAAGYCQFGPLSAYPRALRLRDLYHELPDAPLPAVITCIATTAEARRGGHALTLVEAVCDDLAGRGFAAVEAYPEARAKEDATPAARPEFWIRAGFRLAVDDDRYPVVRREL